MLLLRPGSKIWQSFVHAYLKMPEDPALLIASQKALRHAPSTYWQSSAWIL